MSSALPTQPNMHVRRGAQFIVLISVILPPLALATVMWLTWNNGFNIIDLSLFFGMYLLCGYGITIGFHRYFSHKSFDCPRWVKIFLGISGSMAVQGNLFWWVAVHRKHHKHSDEDDDPHSPHAGHGGRIRKFLYSHFGWLFDIQDPGEARFVPDLMKDPDLRFVSRMFPVWVVISMLIPTVLGGVLTGTWFGALTGFLWGGLVRVFFEHHVTWSINSVCHIWGAQPYDSHDHSRNNVVFGVLALGEGWHNNHHAFPTSARHGLKWWQFDTSWLIIKMMSLVGMASKVKTPSQDRLARAAANASNETPSEN
ncbi:MAG: fatty acid desaturase [Phycisphaerales bacterium]|nr:fatty acid desaturase [Phycisphaerales bacterium]